MRNKHTSAFIIDLINTDLVPDVVLKHTHKGQLNNNSLRSFAFFPLNVAYQISAIKCFRNSIYDIFAINQSFSLAA